MALTISNYQYRLNDGDWVARAPASAASPLTLNGLEIGSAYEVSLRAVNTKGAGASSEAGSFSLPQQSIFVEAQEGNLTLAIETEAGSTCSIDPDKIGLRSAPAIEDNVELAYPNMLDFSLVRCATGESVDVRITLSEDPPVGSVPYKYTGGVWSIIEGATLSDRVIRYTLVDGGPLDESSIPGQIDDPATVAVPAAPIVPAAPVPLPLWLFAMLTGLLGWLGCRRLKLV